MCRDGGETLGVKGTVPRDVLLQVFFIRNSANLEKYVTTGVDDTGFNDADGQFTGGVVYTGISSRIFDNFKWRLGNYHGLWGR